ncbi:sensor histidine kinase [Candidatus Enterococcus ferrettii]|uniref:histidine kinase n=1 Tax=Candidatus Enterococcus ferrettii TaxID=2815324 RepID=A0ABV0ES00_9ENTE|nr:ATP-binding protein [Enterococcus sp. 665A]MBO1341969.1 sensor histidine kinase [Enterococcus sp. 665A]
MGFRRAKIIGFILSIIIVSVGLISWNYFEMRTALEYDRTTALGRLSENEALSEAQLIEAFNQEGNKTYYAKGSELEAKYGMDTRETKYDYLVQPFLVRNTLILLVTILLVLLLFFWNLREQKLLMEELESLENKYHTEKSQYSILLQRTRQEDSQIKSSITDIAHQLKTPVASLKLSMDIALSEAYSPAERQEFSDQAVLQINKLNLMLDGLAKISQMETDLIQINPQKYSLRKLVSEAINSVIIKALERDIDIELSSIDESTIFVDYKWTLEALSNVLENAIKYSPVHTKIQVNSQSLVTYVVLEILDEGPGIPKQEQTLIYQRFYRGENSNEVEGSGVGLYLTRKIIEEQGGTILVKNRVDQGANFQLTLPLV